MDVRSAVVMFFSPTGSTKKIAREITRGFGSQSSRMIDMTTPEGRRGFDGDISEDIVIIAMPVYEETIPEAAEQALSRLKGKGQPAVLAAVYGNIGYGIALLQLKDIAQTSGFRPIAAGAFIAEHSFCTKETPVAPGRPDAEDMEKAFGFGQAVKQMLEDGIPAVAELNVKGRLPLMARILPKGSAGMFTHVPTLDASQCNRCGACVRGCPVGAIDPVALHIDPKLCLRCFACAKRCPKKARAIVFKKKMLVKRVLKARGGKRKEPELFFAPP